MKKNSQQFYTIRLQRTLTNRINKTLELTLKAYSQYIEFILSDQFATLQAKAVSLK